MGGGQNNVNFSNKNGGENLSFNNGWGNFSIENGGGNFSIKNGGRFFLIKHALLFCFKSVRLVLFPRRYAQRINVVGKGSHCIQNSTKYNISVH